MWASLPTWLLGDGQIGELGLGDVIPDCGLRLNCSRLAASNHTLETVDERPTDGSRQVRYRLVGRCQAVTAPMAALIRMPGWLTVAAPETHRVVSRYGGASALEPWSAHFQAPKPEQMVEAEGWLQVVAEHEWDASPIPDSRMDWRIRGIQLLRHRMVPVSEQHHPGSAVRFGPIIKVTELDRLDLAAEWLMNAQYILNLEPK